jgi:hypothetical protein
VLAGGGVAAWALIDPGAFGAEEERTAPAPQVVVPGGEPEDAPDLGFPGFATKNTTRIAGADAVADSVGAALAAFPATGGLPGPDAVTMVAEHDWPAGIAASVLVAAPVGAPVLVGDTEGVPGLTLDALAALAPEGSGATGGAQLLAVGDVAVPSGMQTRTAGGANPAELAAEVERLRRRLTGRKPDRIVLASSDEPAFAMPAAAWAARSGDPVLFVQRDSVPGPTLRALKRYPNIPVFLLGPRSAASGKVMSQLEKAKVNVERIAGPDPVANAIAFARFAGPAGFGWGVADPGHGLAIANAGRPADAGAAAVLSASGKWGPLLLVEDAEILPPTLEGYLLDIKPGFVTDPTRAVYNHVWVIGDSSAVSVEVQAQVDELAELAKVG